MCTRRFNCQEVRKWEISAGNDVLCYCKSAGEGEDWELESDFAPHIEGRERRDFGQGKGESSATIRADSVVAGKFEGMQISLESKGGGGMGGGGVPPTETKGWYSRVYYSTHEHLEFVYHIACCLLDLPVNADMNLLN